jgi:predicted CoA-substrate-specific enzyme activase
VDLAVGIDVGSVAVKALAFRPAGGGAFDEGRPLAWLAEASGPHLASQCSDLLRRLLERCGGSGQAVTVCATGYGRNRVEGASLRVSEILANAAGAGWLYRHWAELAQVFGDVPSPPSLTERFRTIVDVGGQDSKVITFDADGTVRDFAMNDRCAAGTGRFLEVMAGVLGADLVRLDAMAQAAPRAAALTSACTVFAESEVISLIAEGTPPEQVAAAVFQSIAEQVGSLADRCGWRPPVLFDGGAAAGRALRAALAGRLGCEPAVPPCAQFTTALGAALLAADRSPGCVRGLRSG